MKRSQGCGFYWRYLGAFAVVLFFPFSSHAEDLSILDQRALIRAIHPAGEPLRVHVQLAQALKGIKLRLKSVDGVAPDVFGEEIRPGSFVFSGLTKGTWQLSGIEATVTLSEVKIEAGNLEQEN